MAMPKNRQHRKSRRREVEGKIIEGLFCGNCGFDKKVCECPQPSPAADPSVGELLPCPFCGETPLACSFYMNQGTKWGGVRCCIDGPEVRTGYDDSRNAPWHKEAIKAWNKRV